MPLGRAHPPFFIADSNEHECIIILAGLRSHKHSGRTVSVSNKCRVCHFSSCFAQNLSCSKKALALIVFDRIALLNFITYVIAFIRKEPRAIAHV